MNPADYTNGQEADAPDLGRIRDVTARYPVSRSWIYREAAAGNLRLLKLGSVTLVDLASLRDRLAGLPLAKIRPLKTVT